MKNDGNLKFYRTGENTEGTTRFDKEYFQIAETEFIHLNKNGALVDLPTNAGKPKPENVTDLDWYRYERVTPNRVPADYTSTGKTIAFDNPQLANDKINVLKRYVVDNNLAKGTWDEAKAINALKLAVADGVKVEITEIGESGDGKTEYKVSIDDESLQKLRARLADYKREVSQDVKDGKAGGIEQTKIFIDLGGVIQESGRKIGEALINIPQDTLNSVLYPQTGERTGSEPNYGRAKIGEEYNIQSKAKRDENYNGMIPRIDTSPLKTKFESEMMRRDMSGKVDGNGTKTGDAVSTGASIIAPLIVGRVVSKGAPNTLKTSGALLEVEATANAKAISEATAKKPIQKITNKFPDEPLPTTGRIDGIAKIENGRIKLDKSIATNKPIDFVVDKQGNLILGSKHHLPGNAGEVQAAGQMKISGGKIKSITNESGHYRPTIEEARKYPEMLRKMGLELKNTHLKLWEFKFNADGWIVNQTKVVDEYLK